ncbi:hypothetical protein N7476_002644 [Penicillium atrosanguineum]|uniref:Uncharacterized protein n=1 Tax=Penicillium atrosanguineum TaxID=1132637 RepID=A0A9W9Q440_9EURO|nr:hypothetical protein N7476_002644 [Penicillium atrosanguineum]
MASLEDESPSRGPSGTFSCLFPGCNAKYRRKEHLRRHETKHSQQQGFACPVCGIRFGRSDTLRRHMRQRHKSIEPLNRARRACKSCHAGKSRCEGGVPCDGCLRRRIQCFFDDDDTIETERPISSAYLASSLEHDELQSNHPEKKEQYIRLYFKNFHPFWPFIHIGSFNINRETPLLLQSMTVIGLWSSGEKSSQSAAVELHEKLHLAIRDQKANWDVSDEDETSNTLPWPISTYQAILLHVIFSLILRSRDTLDFDFKVSLPPAEFELLETLVRSCRKRGMFFYPNMLTRFKEVGLASFAWVCTEEVKRFNLALYKTCGKLSSTNLEKVIFNFLCPKIPPLWNAIGKPEWLVLLQDEDSLCVDDDCQEPWISSMIGVFEYLRL